MLTLSDLRKEPLFALVYDCFNLPHRQVKLFCKTLVCDSIKQPAAQDSPVSLGISADDPLVYRFVYRLS